MNISDCKFENARSALRECLDHISSEEETTKMQIHNAMLLYETFKMFISNCEEYGFLRECDGEYEFFNDD